MPPKKLLLLDIDGTLLTTNGRGRNAFRSAIQEALGKPFNASGISFSGKTDPQILTEILKRMGIDATPRDALWTKVLTLYEDHMFDYLQASDIQVLPGVRELLETLSTLPSVQLALLTGNLERTAYLKLRLAELQRHFPFGAFGSDDADRNALPSVAIRKAFEFSGYRFEGKDVVVVGDTIRDIECAHRASAMSVAVCTGTFSRTELETFGPDVLLDDLTQPEHFIEMVINR